MSTDNEDLWRGFCENFDDAVFLCAEKGTSQRLVISIGGFPVCVDVYPEGGTMKKFDQMILKSVKAETGIDLIKEVENE